MIVEGVTYDRYVVRYTLKDGRRRKMVRWSPAYGLYIRSEITRELVDRFGIDGIRHGSVTVSQKASGR